MAINFIKNLKEAIEKDAEYLILENTKLKKFPLEILSLKRLKRLAIMGAEIEEIPKEITKLKKLTHLYVKKCKLKSIPVELCQMEKLIYLILSDNQIKYLPEEISDLSKLKFLYCENNQLTSLPESLKKHTTIQEIDCRGNQITSFPDDFSGMTSMVRFILRNNKVKEFPFGIYTAKKKFSVGIDEDLKGELNDSDELWKFVKRCQKLKLDLKTFKDYFYIAANRKYEIEKLEQKVLLQALNSKIPTVVRNALEKLIPENQEIELSEKDELYIAAKTSLKKTELKKRMEKIGLKLVNSIGPKTSHLLIGEKIKDVSGIENTKLNLISEQQLVRFLDKVDAPYILEANSEVNTDHIKDLVMSMQDGNMGIAVEILASGGVPENFITELFIINRFSGQASARKKAKNLLSQHGSNKLVAVLKKRKALNERMHPHYIRENIACYAEDTELNATQIAEAMYNKFGTAGGYILSEGSEEQQLNLLNKLIQGDSLSIKNIRMNNFPQALFTFKNLRKLELSFDGRLTSVMGRYYDSIAESFPNLEELSMPKLFFYDGNLSDLNPLKKLKKLKKVNLEFTKEALVMAKRMFPNWEITTSR